MNIPTAEEFVMKGHLRVEDDEQKDNLAKSHIEFAKLHVEAALIIPKEEPTEEAKQRAKNYMSLKGALEPKQESLEEAAQRLYPGVDRQVDRMLFINGAKWQQETMYSEEEVDKLISIIEWYDNESDVRPDVEIFMWFEQFKKK